MAKYGQHPDTQRQVRSVSTRSEITYDLIANKSTSSYASEILIKDAFATDYVDATSLLPSHFLK